MRYVVAITSVGKVNYNYKCLLVYAYICIRCGTDDSIGIIGVYVAMYLHWSSKICGEVNHTHFNLAMLISSRRKAISETTWWVELVCSSWYSTQQILYYKVQ